MVGLLGGDVLVSVFLMRSNYSNVVNIGRVKVARHSKTGVYAAIKIVSKTQLANSLRSIHNLGEEAERILLGLEREIVIMKLIDHPNVMRLYDVWETAGELYLVLEYVAGGELFDYICERGRLPAEEALDYFQQLMAAIDYCHRFNIAHRDLKPENLLLDNDKNLKVADFGMAAWQRGAGDLLETSCGSPHYAAPEVVSGEPYNGAVSDTWSCGVILFALLAGRLPFDDENLAVLLDKIKLGKFVMPADIPDPAQDLIKKMLEKDPKKRIKIADVLKHPWYLSQPPRKSTCAPPSLQELAKPVPDVAGIEPDILANLRTLWHGAPDEDIIAELTNDEQNWEKAVYHLLVQYRERQLEDYKEVERIRTQRRKERKRRERAEKERERAARRLEERDRPTTPMARPSRPDPPTPRRAGGHASNPSTSSYRQSVPSTPYDLRTPSSLGPSVLTPSTNAPSVLTSPGSPIWDALDVAPPPDAPELNDAHVQKFFQQIYDHLNAMQSRPVEGLTPGTMASPVTVDARSPQGMAGPSLTARAVQIQRLDVPQKDSRGLGISSQRNNNSDNDKENENDSGSMILKKSSLRKPGQTKSARPALADRHVQIILPPPIERNHKSSEQYRRVSGDSYASSSPTYSLSEGSSISVGTSGSGGPGPKHSWFSNLFNFRPTAFSLASVHDVPETRETCKLMLMSYGVTVVSSSSEGLKGGGGIGPNTPSVLRCHLEEIRDLTGVMAVTKAVKFRVEVCSLSQNQAAEAGYATTVQLIQEKGALSSFKLIFQRLRKDWGLDETDKRELETNYVLQNPRSPVEGRFFEDLGY